MGKPFEQRNQTDTAKRKLKSLAKASNLDVEFVTLLANFTWDYDPKYGTEAAGWVSEGSKGSKAKAELKILSERMGLPTDFQLSRQEAAQALIISHGKCDPGRLWSHFSAAAVSKNYGLVSEFASFAYLRGLNQENASRLAWNRKSFGLVDLAGELFAKIFRGGAIERDDLAYLWCDLVLPFPYNSLPKQTAGWINPLLDLLEQLPPKSKLTDLLACCKGLIGGDKFFKQEVLQALAYADVLQVEGWPISEFFLAERRDELSPHFFSNEWSVPLRFWTANGGRVNRAAVASLNIDKPRVS